MVRALLGGNIMFAKGIGIGLLMLFAFSLTAAAPLRFLCDDVKALYGEAAQAAGAAPSSLKVDTWFWRQTVAGQLLIALRGIALSSENNALRTVGGRFFVPVPWLP
jgi:hypothetical protein